jgi:hypothetical protein
MLAARARGQFLGLVGGFVHAQRKQSTIVSKRTEEIPSRLGAPLDCE